MICKKCGLEDEPGSYYKCSDGQVRWYCGDCCEEVQKLEKITNHDGIEMTNRIDLPNGCSLYWEDNTVGGRTYYSDEVGGGVIVWDTALVDISTLLAAITNEMKLQKEESMKNT